ncbi:MAG: hypothetical protein Q4P13_08095 [Psychrobacter sp.]|nr:hypothetical protein [Psychrobacter sp.]
MKYTVTRQHLGDQQYFEGDERQVDLKQDAERLIAMGLIEENKQATAPANKQAAAPKNKTEPETATANKAAK